MFAAWLDGPGWVSGWWGPGPAGRVQIWGGERLRAVLAGAPCGQAALPLPGTSPAVQPPGFVGTEAFYIKKGKGERKCTHVCIYTSRGF